jgi:regulator of protease activity HflC (stomatin/prohibitin superfamily)
MSLPIIIATVVVGVILLAAIVYIVSRYYEARYDRTYMTQDDRGFKRGLKGRTILWDFEETVVKGPSAPHIEYVALDPATGGRRNVKLLDPRTGAINLRPQYCAPLPFEAVTLDSHKVIVDARVQFSLNRDLLKHVYEIQEFALALETRIQSAFRSEIGKRPDEDLRATLHEVERAAIEHLRRAETEGDESGEPGMALGVRFHTASFTYTQPDEFSASGPGASVPIPAGATPEQAAAIRAAARAAGVLTLRPQQIDQLADVFKGRDPNATAAILALLDMQTRQNIAEALAASGQLIVITPQELGLVGAAAMRESAARAKLLSDGVAPAHPNGGVRPEART